MENPNPNEEQAREEGQQDAAEGAATEAPRPAVTRYIFSFGVDINTEAVQQAQEASDFTIQGWGDEAPRGAVLTGIAAGICEAMPALLTAADSPDPKLGEPFRLAFEDPFCSNMVCKIDAAVPGYALCAENDQITREVRTILDNMPNAVRGRFAGGQEDLGTSLARSIEAYVPPDLLQALLTIDRLQNFGDATYRVRDRAVENDPNFEGNSWDHPDVQAYSDAVQVVKSWLPTAKVEPAQPPSDAS